MSLAAAVSLIGPNSLQAAGERMKKLHFKKALIVTDEVG